MLRLGFCEKWVNWIVVYVTSVQYYVNVNRKNGGSVLRTRGIRQGDPLLPYLSIMVVDVLSLLLTKAMAQGELKCIRIKRECPSISHLSFSNDSIFSLQAEWNNALKLKSIIDLYCRVFG